MHEMGIANSILEAVRRELQCYPDAHTSKVGVRIGEMQAIDEDSLQFCFEVLVRDSDLHGLKLEIELCPRRHRCGSCQFEFTVCEYDFRCPQCREISAECVSGDQLELTYVEIEKNEPSALGTKSTQ
jgi:hydrogenase nickel incorporation protein HypA/HybF